MTSYLESFERINFFGEDAEDVLSAGRPHTPVGGGTFPTHVPSVAASGMYTTLKHTVYYVTGDTVLTNTLINLILFFLVQLLLFQSCCGHYSP